MKQKYVGRIVCIVILWSAGAVSADSRPPSAYPPKEYFDRAFDIVVEFENGGQNAYKSITLDFDKQGISIGVFQWNIGQGSIRTLLKPVDKAIVLKYMPNYGEEFYKAYTEPKSDGLKRVRDWQEIYETGAHDERQRNARWRPEYHGLRDELTRLLGSSECIAAQKEQARVDSQQAWQDAREWAHDSRKDEPRLREFAAFLDNTVHSGTMAGLTYKDVLRWRKAHRDRTPSIQACRWLVSLHKPMLQTEDANSNADAWTRSFPLRYQDLLLLFWLRAEECYGSDGRAQAIALCRRGTILSNHGRVNGAWHQFDELEESNVDKKDVPVIKTLEEDAADRGQGSANLNEPPAATTEDTE